MIGYFFAIAFKASVNILPILFARWARLSRSIISIAPNAAAHATGFPPYVPPRPLK